MATAPLSLFNTPQQYQQQQWAQAQEQAKALADMSASQRATYGAAMGGTMLGNALPGLLGVEDPELVKIKDIQGMFRGVDRNDYKSLESFAKALADKGYSAEAEQAWQKAQEAKRLEADIGLKNAQRDKALRDPSFRSYEYEQMMEILNDPEATDEQKKLAQARIDALNEKAKGAGKAGGTGRAIKFESAGGTYWLDPYNKKVTTLGGRELSPEEADKLIAASNDPTLQGALAASKEGNKDMAKGNVAAQLALPKLRYQTEISNIHIDELLNHPGFNSAVGATLKPGAKLVQGSPEASFKARYEQLKGEAFNQAYESLRGGGSITENETKQAGAALNRMDTATSEAEFRAAAEDFRRAVKAGLKIMEEKANMRFANPNTPQPAPTVQPVASSQRSAPFSGVTTPNQVRDLYRQGKLTKQDANIMLDDMKARGMF